jgi:hypothetical protein
MDLSTFSPGNFQRFRTAVRTAEPLNLVGLIDQNGLARKTPDSRREGKQDERTVSGDLRRTLCFWANNLSRPTKEVVDAIRFRIGS